MSLATTIAGYHVELDPDADYGDGPRSQCFVSRTIRGVEYTASLAALVDAGELFDPEAGEYPVPPTTIDRIVTWAIERGY